MKKIILLIVLIISGLNVFAQSKELGDKYRKQGDYEKAAEAYRKCMEKDEDCLYGLIMMLDFKEIKPTPQYTEHLYRLILPLAKNGDIIAQHSLGILFNFGFGVTENFRKAFFWYKKSAEQIGRAHV